MVTPDLAPLLTDGLGDDGAADVAAVRSVHRQPPPS